MYSLTELPTSSMVARICTAAPFVLLVSLYLSTGMAPERLQGDEEDCESVSLLQVKTNLHTPKSSQVVKLEEQKKYRMCDESVAVNGSEMRLPARGFITCCGQMSGQPNLWTDSLVSYLQLGGRFIDTAPDYFAERQVGEAVRQSGISRDQLWIESKVDTDFWRAVHGSAKQWTLSQVEQSLKRLNVSYLDSMLLHFGPRQVHLQAPETTLLLSADDSRLMGSSEFVEMWRGLIEAKKQGKVRNIGVCETSQSEIEHLIQETGVQPAIVLVWYNPWIPPEQANFVQWAKDKGMAVVAYGLFNWKYIPNENSDEAKQRVQAATKVGKRHNMTYGQLMIKWALEQGISFATAMDSEWLEEDSQCLDGTLDADDHKELALVSSWNCSVALKSGQYFSGC